MRRLLFLCFFFLLAQTSRAYDLRLRSVFPNPTGSDEGEWIAVENISQATISAQLYAVRDVYGSVKTFGLGSFSPLELKTVLASQSGITLNNTEEMVELLYLGEVIESSPKLVASQEGKVFVRLESGWNEVSEAEYLARKGERRWGVPSPVNDSESKTENPGVVQLLENAEGESGAEEILPNRDDLSVKRVFPSFLKRTRPSATPSGLPSWPMPPEPDYDQEMAVFLEWKREALVGSLALIFGGACLLTVTLPPVPTIWRWLREELLL